MSGKRIAAVLAAAGVLSCMPQQGVADESGSFTTIAVLTSSYTRLHQSGETIFAGPSEGSSVITESSGDPFAVGDRSEIECVAYGRSSASRVSLEASCTVKFGLLDGKLYLLSKRTGETGHIELLGGTEKYDGIVGGCDYEVARVSPEVNVTTAKCTWKR